MGSSSKNYFTSRASLRLVPLPTLLPFGERSAGSRSAPAWYLCPPASGVCLLSYTKPSVRSYCIMQRAVLLYLLIYITYREFSLLTSHLHVNVFSWHSPLSKKLKHSIVDKWRNGSFLRNTILHYHWAPQVKANIPRCKIALLVMAAKKASDERRFRVRGMFLADVCRKEHCLLGS